MVRMIVRHTVSDYDRWRAGHDAFDSKRVERGVIGHGVYCAVGERCDVTVTMDFATPAQASDFADFIGSDSEREAMHAGGVLGDPQIWVVEEV
jgi:hypothetical protein